MSFPLDTRVLLVEDTEITRRIVSKMLEKMGFAHRSVVQNGKQALQRLEEASDVGRPFGLVLADWKMPEMTGMELLHRIRRSRELRSTPVVMLTTNVKKEQVMDAIAAGVTNYLAKPFVMEDLEKKLEETWFLLHRKKTG